MKSKKCPSRTKPNDHFRNLVAEVREDAYKKYNNCTSFPKEGFDKLKEKYGVKFVDHEDDFFNFPADPLTDFALQCSIVGPNGNGTLDNFYLDPMHNILNIVNLQILDSIKDAAINRGIYQGMKIDSFSVSQNSKKYEAFDLLSLQNHFCPKKLYFALNIACSSVTRSFQTANGLSKSDQARAAASDQEADGKQSAKLLRNISLICTSLVHERKLQMGRRSATICTCEQGSHAAWLVSFSPKTKFTVMN